MLLDHFWNRGQGRILNGSRLYLRSPVLDDWSQWAAVREASRSHLIPWEPLWPKGALTKRSFKNRLRRYSVDARADTGYAFFLFKKGSDELVGGITLSNVRRGVAQTGTIGYWTGLPYVRQGYMFEGLSILLPVLFDRYSLRRIEAACLPENRPSAELLLRTGFTAEGRARQYLNINGNWQDHLLFAIIKGDQIGQPASRFLSGMTDIAGE